MADFGKITKPLSTSADLTRTSYRWAVKLLIEVNDEPLALICSTRNGASDVYDFVEDYVSVHPIEKKARTLGGHMGYIFPVEMDAWILVGKKGNVIFSEGA